MRCRVLCGDLPDVVDDPVEGALAAAQRPHPVVRVAIAVERDLDAVQAEGVQPIDDLRGQQQPVGDDVDEHADAARVADLPHPLGEVVHHRQVEQRLAAEERQHEAFRAQRVEPLLGPVADPRRRLERHLRGVLVVVAVIALDAVVAGEVALQRGEHRHAQLLAASRTSRKNALQVVAVGVAALDDEAVLGERADGVALLARPAGRIAVLESIQQRRHVGRHDQLGIGERVHQEDLVLVFEGNTDVEHRGLHARSLVVMCVLTDGIATLARWSGKSRPPLAL